MTDWSKVQLKSLCYKITKGTTPTTSGGRFVDTGINFIKSESIGYDGSIDETKFAFIDAETHEKLKRSQIVAGDILYSIAGVHLGKSASARPEHLPANTNQAVAIIRVEEDKANRKFIEYVLRNRSFVEQVLGGVAQSAQPNVNLTEIGQFLVPLPPRLEQEKVAGILTALDDKIELNRRMNETLEAMARAIFKDWFIDFGPTRAKAQGRAPYLAPELWNLFPDALDGEDKPVGWQDDVLGSFTNLQNGYAFKRNDWRDLGVPVVKIGSVKPAFVDLDHVSFVDEALALEKINFRLSTDDMLVGLTGYVGETGRIPPTQYTPMLNQRVGRFLPNPGLEPFVFSAVRRPEFKEFAESKSHGSAQANVSTKDLLTYPLPNPGELIIKTFCDIASPLFKNSLANSGQTSILAQTRDLLLPKLMSGEIRLIEAEKAVEAVA